MGNSKQAGDTDPFHEVQVLLQNKVTGLVDHNLWCKPSETQWSLIISLVSGIQTHIGNVHSNPTMKHGNLGQRGLFYRVAFVLRLIKSFDGISGCRYCASTVRGRDSTVDRLC